MIDYEKDGIGRPVAAISYAGGKKTEIYRGRLRGWGVDFDEGEDHPAFSVAIIEKADGSVALHYAGNVQFLDATP